MRAGLARITPRPRARRDFHRVGAVRSERGRHFGADPIQLTDPERECLTLPETNQSGHSVIEKVNIPCRTETVSTRRPQDAQTFFPGSLRGMSVFEKIVKVWLTSGLHNYG